MPIVSHRVTQYRPLDLKMKNYLPSWHWSTKLIVSIGIVLTYIFWSMENKNSLMTMSGKTNIVEQAFELSDSVSSISGIGEEQLWIMPPLESFSAIVDRPLFSSTRRKAESDTVAEEFQMPESIEFPLLRFVGTIDEGQKIKALTDGPRGLRALLVGDHFDGWQVAVVERRRMVLVRDDEYLDLQILDRPS
jgi:hypothetical protein